MREQRQPASKGACREGGKESGIGHCKVSIVGRRCVHIAELHVCECAKRDCCRF